MNRIKKVISFAIVLAMLVQCCIYRSEILEVEASEAEKTEETEEAKESENTEMINQEEMAEQTLETEPGATADNTVPEITSIKLLTTGDIYSNTEVQYEVEYQDGDADITNISMMFEGTSMVEDSYYPSVTLYSDYSTVFGSSGAVVLKTGDISIGTGEYRLRFASITDRAGNNIQYNYNEERNAYIATDGKGAEHILKIDNNTLIVKRYPFKGLELKSLRIEDGIEKDKLTAGDTFVMTATLKNTSETVQIVRPNTCFAHWKNPALDIAGSGSNYSLNPGEEGKINFEVSINPYASVGENEFEEIKINSHEEWEQPNEEVSYFCSGNGLYGFARISGKSVPIESSIPYNKEADYTVINSEETDTEAPYIESVSVNTSSVKTPGEISFDIKVSEEGFAKAAAFRLEFNDKSEGYRKYRNVISLDSDKAGTLTYSKERECYVYTVDLDISVVKAVYELTRISVRDQAGNGRGYQKNSNGEFEDLLSNTTVSKICDLEVAESQSKDYDFQSPVLLDCVPVDEAVTAGGEIQYRIKAEDDSGLSEVTLEFRNDLTLVSDKITEADGEYLCSFQVDKYTSGNYELAFMVLQDGSIHKNKIKYLYNSWIWNRPAFFEWDHQIIVDENAPVYVQSDFNLTIQQLQDIVLTDNNVDSLNQAIETVKNNGTIVIKNTADTGQTGIILPAAVLEKAKEKQAVLVVPGINNTSEIVIEGSAITQVPSGGIGLEIHREDLINKEITVSGEKDNLYYPIAVTISDTTIPVTARIKLDKDFISKCGKNPIRISKMTDDGQTVLLADNLTVGDDGYVEVTLQNGFSGNIASQILYSDITGSGARSEAVKAMEFVVSSKIMEVKPGDIDGDGNIKMADLMMCLHHVSGRTLLSGTQFTAADIDGDGKIAMADLMKLLHFVSGRNEVL